MNFWDNVKNSSNRLAKTENGANTLNSTLNSNVDLFGKSVRFLTENDMSLLFAKAYAEDSEMAIKNALNLLDIRTGKGERRAFKVIVKYLLDKFKADSNNALLINHIGVLYNAIEELGRWDYIFEFWPIFKHNVIATIKIEMKDKNSLLPKWMPSLTHSRKQLAKELAKELFEGNNIEEQYRKWLVNARKHLNLVETQMTENNWSEIDYSKVPSKANIKYGKAFMRHDNERRSEFFNKVNNGEVKMNAKVLYPYEVFNKWRNGNDNRAEINALWKSIKQIELPKKNILVVADTSGSMVGTPIANSIALAKYISERNFGVFKDKSIVFSDNPRYVDIAGLDTFDSFRELDRGDVASTNFLGTMQLIANSLAPLSEEERKEQAPEYMIILTDMQFDSGVNINQTIHEEAKQLFTDLGVEMPNIIYWNLESYDNMPVTANEYGVAIISGFSTNILDNLFNLDELTPYKIMVNTLAKYDKYLV